MSSGAAPPGISGEKQTSRWVRSMFGKVAPRYDLLNHLLSLQTDRYWRWRTVRQLGDILERRDAVVLDVCCGSGDLTLALRRGGQAKVYGSDFCHPMLLEASAKDGGRLGLVLFESDALQLPVANGSIDLVTAAFGFRNLANYQAGLAELLRVLKPGGTAAILEFSTPPNAAFRGLYNFYSTRVLPVLGGLISGSREAYSYLPDSVRKFPAAPKLAEEMEKAGFGEVQFRYMTGGIVALHTGVAIR